MSEFKACRKKKFLYGISDDMNRAKYKVIRAGNIIRKYEYEKGVVVGYDINDRYDIEVKDGVKKYYRKRDTIKTVDYIDNNTFEILTVPEVKYLKGSEVKFGSNEGLTEEEKSRNRQVNIRRARFKMMDLINSNVFKSMCGGEIVYPKFLTLTFKEEIQELKEANILFKNFIKRMNYYVNKNKLMKEKIKYIAVAEIQPDRAESTNKEVWHFHVLLLNVPVIHFSVYSEIWEHGAIHIEGFVDKKSKKLIKVEIKENGEVVVGDIEKVNDIGRYMSKTLDYMSKEFENDKLAGQKCYHTSRGLEKPEIEYVKELESKNIIRDISEYKEQYYDIYYSEYTGAIYYSEYNKTKKYNIKEYVGYMFGNVKFERIENVVDTYIQMKLYEDREAG
jgi:hypothetical protein